MAFDFQSVFDPAHASTIVTMEAFLPIETDPQPHLKPGATLDHESCDELIVDIKSHKSLINSAAAAEIGWLLTGNLTEADKWAEAVETNQALLSEACEEYAKRIDAGTCEPNQDYNDNCLGAALS